MTQYRDAENTSMSRPAESGFTYPWDDPGAAEDEQPKTGGGGNGQKETNKGPNADDIPPFDVFPEELLSDDGLDEVRRAVDETMRERYDGTVQSYQLWFDRLRLKALTADRALFVCENSLKLKIIAERFRDLISDSLEEVLGYRPRLELDVDPTLAPDLAGGIRIGPSSAGAQQPKAAGRAKDGDGRTGERDGRGGHETPEAKPETDRRNETETDESDEGWNLVSDTQTAMDLPFPDGREQAQDAGYSRIRGCDGAEGRIDTAGRLAWDEPGGAKDSASRASSFLPGDRPGFMPDPDGGASPSRPAPPLRFTDDGSPNNGIPADVPEEAIRKSDWILPPKKEGKGAAFHDGYTFDNFIVGSSNQMAHAAALSVADNVGLSINPLFIWGPAGLGKTHLMYAIANRAVERDPALRVICVKGEEFMNEMIEAIRKDKNQAFRDKYRKTDMLLIDDIQFIAGKESTQTEFFHTFDALYEDRKQIIITSDRPPKDLTSLESRIRSRFEAGLLVDIQPPDYELRMAILRDKISQSGMEFPAEVIDFLAKNLQENIRQLEGVVKKLSMVHMVSGSPVTMELVLKTVPEYLRNTEPLADTVSRIIETTAAYYSVKVDDILGKERKKTIQTARNVSMYLVRTVTGASFPQIGVFFYRDHSTVHSNIAKVEAEIADDAVFEANVDAILKEIRR